MGPLILFFHDKLPENITIDFERRKKEKRKKKK